MKISLAATNPCHVFPLAVELARAGALGCYYSGYPEWKLGADADPLEVRTHSLRTNVVYGLLKFAPEKLRPSSRRLFLWQDRGFDRWTGAHLEPCDFIHGLPGQCLHTFRAARRLGIRTVLNHATGPVRTWVKIMEPEYARVGLKLEDVCPYDADYFTREDEEYALADFHCAASTVVREQLLALSIPRERIWLVPYGADTRIFHPASVRPADGFRIVFAGQLGLRKGLQTLLAALTLAGRADWNVDCYGAVLGEAQRDLAEYRGAAKLHFHGAVAQPELADAFRAGSVLVLPSLEEGFGLVVPQALNCGLPAIVSDAVGGGDYVRHRDNGSIFPARDAAALAAELAWWAEHPRRVTANFGWNAPAQTLITLSQSALA
ncbi:MAG: glycosyltransferase family 4 protein [Chthoniobacter sp.]|nr:glycosyltransferase family 4 protein [Chthoniobacter sp.]